MKQRFSFKNFAISIGKYLAILLVIYTAINWWRAPTPTQQISSLLPQTVLLNSQKQPVLLYFWATWCGVCSISTPNIQSLHDDGYAVLGISISSGSDKEVQQFLQSHHYQFHNLNDNDQHLFTAWQGKVTPSFAIIHQGKVEQSFTGVAPLWLLKLRLWWANAF